MINQIKENFNQIGFRVPKKVQQARGHLRKAAAGQGHQPCTGVHGRELKTFREWPAVTESTNLDGDQGNNRSVTRSSSEEEEEEDEDGLHRWS